MEQFFEFMANHWILTSAWSAVLILLLFNESMRGGSQLSPMQVTQMINRSEAVVLDIRKKEEFRTGHLPESINIPAANIQSQLGQLEPYKNRPIVLVCKTGTTAGTVGVTLNKAGFDQVSRLRGGIMEWKNSSLPLVKS